MKTSADVFRVVSLNHPPSELRIQTIKTFPTTDFLGDGVLTDPTELVRIIQLLC